VDRRQAGVAGAGAVSPLALEVLEEGADQRRVEVGELELAGLLAGLRVGEAKQQPEAVAVGGDRLGAGVALAEQPFAEEGLQDRGEQVHGSTCGTRSRRSLTSWSGSGAACRVR
jgi:hypothetical protein